LTVYESYFDRRLERFFFTVLSSPVCQTFLIDLYRKMTEQFRPELFDDSGFLRHKTLHSSCQKLTGRLGKKNPLQSSVKITLIYCQKDSCNGKVSIKLYENYKKKKLYLFLLLMLKISWKSSKKWVDKNIPKSNCGFICNI
jgi:hypothetical protein